jgi:hypothetical protein
MRSGLSPFELIFDYRGFNLPYFLILEEVLRREPRLKADDLFKYLQERYPGQYPQVLRTVQRRVRTWKALHGEAPEVMFELRHEAWGDGHL